MRRESHTGSETLLREPQTARKETHAEHEHCMTVRLRETCEGTTKGLRRLLRIDPITSRSCETGDWRYATGASTHEMTAQCLFRI